MAVTYEQVQNILSRDILTGEPLVLNKLRSLTVGDYQKWLRKQVRKLGRRAEVGTVKCFPVEAFVKEMTGLKYHLSAGGEVEVYVDGKMYEMRGPQTLAYYLYEEEDYPGDDSVPVLKAGRALDVALLENPSLPLAA